MRRAAPRHLAWLRTLPCGICGDPTSTEACHVRMSDARIGKINPGVGAKPDDRFVVPMCGTHHREQHSMKESAFWNKYGIDPILMALALFSISGDINEADRIIQR